MRRLSPGVPRERKMLRSVLTLLLSVVLALLLWLAFAAIREGGPSGLLALEYLDIAVPMGATDDEIRTRYVAPGWVRVPGVWKSHGGLQYVLVARMALMKYFPLWRLGIRPEPRW